MDYLSFVIMIVIQVTVVTMSSGSQSQGSQNFTLGITQEGNQIAGENYTLICSILPNLTDNVTNFKWFYEVENTSEIINSSNQTVIKAPSKSKLLFTPLHESQTGTYICQGSHGSIQNIFSHNIMVNVTAPKVEVEIHNSEKNFLLGEEYNLTCIIIGADKLHPMISYGWTHNGAKLEMTDDKINFLSFSPFRLSGAGNYSCTVNISSQYINKSIVIESNNETLEVQTLAPRSVQLSSDPVSPIWPVPSDVILMCTVELNPAVDIPVTVNTVWTGPESNITLPDSNTTMHNLSVYTSTAVVNSFGRTHSGNYSCTANVGLTAFVVNIESSSATTKVTTGVYLSHGVTAYKNYSVFSISEIGNVNMGFQLQCTTDKSPCCKNISHRFGEWIFPDTSSVPIQNNFMTLTFYRNRGDDGTVNLNRLNSGITSPTGLFCCKVPDGDDIMQTLCAYIVTVDLSLTPSGSSIAGETFSLLCAASLVKFNDSVSENAEDATFQWLLSNNASTYSSISGSQLIFDPLQYFHEGTIICLATVYNIIGIHTLSANYNITINAPTVLINISDSGSTADIGRNLSLSCNISGHENLANLSIHYQWLRNDSVLHHNSSNILMFPSLELSEAGFYTCMVTINSSYLLDQLLASGSYTLALKVPSPVSVSISHDARIIAGSSFKLNCIVLLNPNIDISVSITTEWGGPNGTIFNQTKPTEITSTNYTVIAEVNAARNDIYTCQASINPNFVSEFIDGSNSMTGSVTITVDPLPPPSNMTATGTQANSLHLEWSQSDGADAVESYKINYNFIVNECQDGYNSNCFTIHLTNGSLRSYDIINNSDHLVEQDSTYNITLTAVNSVTSSEAAKPSESNIVTKTATPSGSPQNLTATSTTISNITIEWEMIHCLERNGPITKYLVSYGEFQDEIIKEEVIGLSFTAAGLQPRINYSFRVRGLMSNITEPTHSPSATIVTTTSVPQEVGILLNGHLYRNNSIITFHEIGVESESMLCVTNNTECCRKRDNINGMNALGNWYYPDESDIKPESTNPIYKNRGPSVVRLHRKQNVINPSGIYNCIIPDSNGTNQSIFVGIYSMEQGSPSILGLELDRGNMKLTCTSTGGPPTTVTWRKNGVLLNDSLYQQSQIVLNTTTATYENILYSDHIEDLVGSFTCHVINSRGNNSMTISSNGVVIEVDTMADFLVGSIASVVCKSDVDTIWMEWLNSGGGVITCTTVSGQKQLNLTFSPVHDANHSEVYTCRVTRNNETGNDNIAHQNFTLKAQVPLDILRINISQSGSGKAGEIYYLNCSILKKIHGLVHNPSATWLTYNGERIQEESGTTQIVETSKSVLFFNPLKTSHAGNYSCYGNLTSSAPPHQISVLNFHPLKVLIPRPVVTVSHAEEVLYAGTNVSLICNVSLSAAVDSDVSVDIKWYMENISLTNSTKRVIVSPTIATIPLFISKLTLTPLTDEDQGNFTCKANTNSDDKLFIEDSGSEMSIPIFVMQRSPSAPEFHDMELVTVTSVYVAWSQKSDDFIKGFNITSVYIGSCSNYENTTINSDTNPSRRTFNITDLQENSNYSITIVAFNDGGWNSSKVLSITTKPSVPDGPPNDLAVISINLTAVNIMWTPTTCIQQNSIIEGYTVYYKKKSEARLVFNESRNTIDTNTTIAHLDPNTEYVLEVRAVNNEHVTGPPANLTVNTSIPEAIGFLLNDHQYGNNSVVTLTDIGEGANGLMCLTNNTNCCSDDTSDWFLPNANKVQAQGMIFVDRGPNRVRLNQRNNASLPAGIYNCSILNTSNVRQNIYIGIYPIGSGEGIVQVNDLTLNENEQALECTSIGGPPTTVNWTKDGQPIDIDGITYKQRKTIVNASRSIYRTTLFIHPLDQDQNKVIGNYTCRASNFRVSSPGKNQQMNFEIQGIRIIGHERALLYGTLAALNCTTDLAISTIQWFDTKGRVIKNGTGSVLELTDVATETSDLEYTCNVVGKFGNQSKTVTLHVLPSEAVSSPSTVPTFAVVSVIAVLIIIVLAALVIIIIMRRKNHGKLILISRRVRRVDGKDTSDGEGKDKETLEMKTFGKGYKAATVLIPNFGAHVKRMHEDRDKLFEAEYLSISKEPQKSYAVADIAVNRLRNRFGNIFPYDHYRVKLEEIAGAENSDYINASYLDGYEKPRAYVAAQGPLPNTLDDFWRMIWEKRLTTIVMLTQCFEGRKKCECYWPELISNTFEPGQGITVILDSMTPFTEYTVRKMIVTQASKPQLPPLKVTQFHFVAWPDHGVPDNHALMLNFIKRVRKLHPYSNPCPLLVHCSAGVGRTGTFIVLDTMLERMKEEDTLNIYDYVKQLREQRVLMVQTLGQYIFIHDALNEYILSGRTEISPNDIRKVIDELSVQHDPCSAATGFEQQFQILGQLRCVTVDNCYSNATSEENVAKNRYSNKLPNNFHRVHLKSSAVQGSDYINASFIDGYRQKKSYIATQGPLESTVCDFWRMVLENESKCVVLLTQLKENDKEMCYCYWPRTESHTQTYGQISVKLLTQERYGYCDLRKFEINKEKTVGVEGEKTAFTVTQFHFLEWPEHETPPITSSLIELMGNVNKVQMGAGTRPMIVMCNDGVGRTGTFICIHAQLERLKTEGVFDFFQFIKSARMQRAGLVSDSVQYVLCHEVLADYLESFDTYANFKEVM